NSITADGGAILTLHHDLGELQIHSNLSSLSLETEVQIMIRPEHLCMVDSTHHQRADLIQTWEATISHVIYRGANSILWVRCKDQTFQMEVANHLLYDESRYQPGASVRIGIDKRHVMVLPTAD